MDQATQVLVFPKTNSWLVQQIINASRSFVFGIARMHLGDKTTTLLTPHTIPIVYRNKTMRSSRASSQHGRKFGLQRSSFSFYFEPNEVPSFRRLLHFTALTAPSDCSLPVLPPFKNSCPVSHIGCFFLAFQKSWCIRTCIRSKSTIVRIR
jgi:hypothetical protein